MPATGECDEVVITNYSEIESWKSRQTAGGDSAVGVRWAVVILDMEGEMI